MERLANRIIAFAGRTRVNSCGVRYANAWMVEKPFHARRAGLLQMID